MEDNLKKKTNVEEAKTEKKPSYEDLNNWCYQLAEQNKKLRAQVQNMNLTNAFKRQDYLFNIMNIAKDCNWMFPDNIVEQAVDETVNFLFSTEEQTDTNEVETDGENQ